MLRCHNTRQGWLATSMVFLPGEFHGQKNLAGCSPCGHKELVMTEQLTHRHTHTVVLNVEISQSINNFKIDLLLLFSH